MSGNALALERSGGGSEWRVNCREPECFCRLGQEKARNDVHEEKGKRLEMFVCVWVDAPS